MQEGQDLDDFQSLVLCWACAGTCRLRLFCVGVERGAGAAAAAAALDTGAFQLVLRVSRFHQYHCMY
eukprot:SAG31_NODE_1485_length_8151_cov_6.486215_8_plen_67_part_00